MATRLDFSLLIIHFLHFFVSGFLFTGDYWCSLLHVPSVSAGGENADVDIVSVQAFTQLPWTECRPLGPITCVYKVCVVLNVFPAKRDSHK